MSNYRSKMLKTLEGKKVEHLPFVPRLDLWYKSNKRRGTLPSKYKGVSLIEIIDDLGVGYHDVVPDFRNFMDPLSDVDRALGIWRLKDLTYEVKLNVKRNITYFEDKTQVEYITPHGNITTETRYSEKAKNAGITLTDITNRAIDTKSDYDAIAYIFDNIEVSARYNRYERNSVDFGDRGLKIAYANLAASPMHLIQRYLMDYNEFFIEIMENPKELEWLADKVKPLLDKIINVVAKSPVDIALLGANYDREITYPPFFKKYIQPYLKKQSKILNKNDKYLLTHTDGENDGLLEHFLEANIDIADSVCPKPMTKLNLKEYRNTFSSGEITIWGGVPSICVLEESMKEDKFENYIENFFYNEIGKGDHLIVSIADTVPPAAKFSRIEKIARMCKEFGPIEC